MAVGHLLRQAGGRGLALKVVTEATRRSLAARLGLGKDLPLARLDEVLARRAPDVAEEYREAAAQAQAGQVRRNRRCWPPPVASTTSPTLWRADDSGRLLSNPPD